MLSLACCGLILMVSLTTASFPPRHHDPFIMEPPPLPPIPKKNATKSTKIVESFRVRSDIRYRFATTQMSSVVRNVDSTAQEIGFDVTLPKDAFIMAFHMTIDGKRYDGQVKERKEAKREYQAAVDRGESAGHVRQAPRHANVFEVAVNVASGSAVNFTLTYQEVLRRSLGVYEHEIHVNPGQPVADFRVEVHIQENRPLKFVRTPALRKDFLLTNLVDDSVTNDLTLVDRPSPETATILFMPSLEEQGDNQGISARFAVQYDVEHAGTSGDVLVVDGYFVHFMAPDSVQLTLPKDIIFVLDVSGSMYGSKIEQLRVALKTILSDLKPQDRFNIITFSSSTSKWKEGLVDVDESSISTAQEYVKGMRANGMTNINDALLTALSEMKGRHDNERVGMIFFLTDGNPTQGETDANKIARNILNANERTVAIFSLAFGEGADYDSLKSLSAQNLGFARKIYEASDAALQVSSLYNEISAVSIKDMSIKYQNSSVDEFSLTNTEFPMVFNGTEIVICGLLREDTKTLKYEITGLESLGEIDITDEVDSVNVMIANPDEQTDELFTGPRDFSGMVERMWAYQTIRQLLKEKEKNVADKEKVKELEGKILEMSLKYKFVTPLTSMVVTKPDEKETEIKEAKLGALHSEEASVPLRSAPSGAYSQQMPSFSHHRHLPMMSKSVYSPIGRPFVDPVPSHINGSYGPVFMPPDPVMAGRKTQRTSKKIKTNKNSASTNHNKKYNSKNGSSNNTNTHPDPPAGNVSTLALFTFTELFNASSAASLAPKLCVVPRRWKFGTVILLSGPDGARVVLNHCSRRQCKQHPSLKSLRFEVGREALEVELDNSFFWKYVPRSVCNVSVVSREELSVSCPKLTTTIKRSWTGGIAGYKLNFVLESPGKYSGLLGNLTSRPDVQLKRLSKKKSKIACKDEGSAFSVMINRKMARKFSAKQTRRRSRANRKGVKGQRSFRRVG
ncbi:hypothetical protein EGW08_002744 [Elysia chlorotica]|uniref:VWFA domain-containing protein n=1 Tax=Elysia chlorotica TaxID=188477 RepID=A0A433U6R5_ELYCH|nr:hypothetical protein EGW08_002744 [Elysia chlorotica]